MAAPELREAPRARERAPAVRLWAPWSQAPGAVSTAQRVWPAQRGKPGPGVLERGLFLELF